MKRKILCVLLISLVIGTYNIKALAASVDSLNKSKSQAEAGKSEAQAQLNSIQSEKKNAMDEVSEISSQMSAVQAEIDGLQSQIDELNDSITTKESEIEEKEKDITAKQELLKTRLVAMYKNGNISYIDVLLGSSNYIDMIASYDQIHFSFEDKEVRSFSNSDLVLKTGFLPRGKKDSLRVSIWLDESVDTNVHFYGRIEINEL